MILPHLNLQNTLYICQVALHPPILITYSMPLWLSLPTMSFLPHSTNHLVLCPFWTVVTFCYLDRIALLTASIHAPVTQRSHCTLWLYAWLLFIPLFLLVLSTTRCNLTTLTSDLTLPLLCTLYPKSPLFLSVRLCSVPHYSMSLWLSLPTLSFLPYPAHPKKTSILLPTPLPNVPSIYLLYTT